MNEHDWLLSLQQLSIRSSAQLEPNKKCFEVARTQLFQDGALENLLCVCGSLCFDCAVLVPPGHWTDVLGDKAAPRGCLQ